MYSCWQREKSSHCHLGNNFLLPVSLHTHPEVPIQKKGLINPKVPKQLIYNNLHVERNHCKSCWGGQEAIKTEDCFETMVLVEFSLLTFLFSKHRRIPAYLLHFPNTQQENNFFRALLILKKITDFCDLLMFGKPTKHSGEKRKTPQDTIMHREPTETPATSPHSGLSAVLSELSWTSAMDPKYSMSLQDHKYS